MGGWRNALGVLGTACALVLSGCAAPGGQPWAAEAEAWFAGLDATFEEQALRHAYYYTPDAVNNSTVLDERFYATGRWPVMQLQSRWYAYENLHGPLHLSRDGAVRSHIVVIDEGGRFERVRILLGHVAIGKDGIERHTHLAHTEWDYRIRRGQDQAVAAAEEVAAKYLAAWAGGSLDLIWDLYAAEAVVVDDLRGLSARGHSDIAVLAAASAPIVAQTNAEVVPQRVLDLAPEVAADVPAVFLAFDSGREQVPTQVWLPVRSQHRCPGSSVVALELDDQQRVVAERRFAAPASVRTCADPDTLPTGWWTGRDLPLPFGERVTGTVDTAAGAVEVRNGWPPADAVLSWAFGQFETAGLPAPAVSSVAFDPFDPLCQEFPGYAEWGDGTTDILICFDSARIGEPPGQDPQEPDVAEPSVAEPTAEGPAGPEYLPQRGRLLLHELGHAWLANHTDEGVRQEFMDAVGVENWNDKGEPWTDRGAEWAAETLAHGLQGIPSTSPSLGTPDCSVLAEGFRILTGAEPLTPCNCERTPAPSPRPPA